MKKYLLFLIIILISLTTCKENEPTAPEEEIPLDVLAETTIGPKRGMLETQDFTLVVPKKLF